MSAHLPMPHATNLNTAGRMGAGMGAGAPAPTLSPARGVDYGGTNNDALNEHLNTNLNLHGGPVHPALGTYLGGKYRGKTPGQAREIETQNFHGGARAEGGGIGGMDYLDRNRAAKAAGTAPPPTPNDGGGRGGMAYLDRNRAAKPNLSPAAPSFSDAAATPPPRPMAPPPAPDLKGSVAAAQMGAAMGPLAGIGAQAAMTGANAATTPPVATAAAPPAQSINPADLPSAPLPIGSQLQKSAGGNRISGPNGGGFSRAASTLSPADMARSGVFDETGAQVSGPKVDEQARIAARAKATAATNAKLAGYKPKMPMAAPGTPTTLGSMLGSNDSGAASEAAAQPAPAPAPAKFAKTRTQANGTIIAGDVPDDYVSPSDEDKGDPFDPRKKNTGALNPALTSR